MLTGVLLQLALLVLFKMRIGATPINSTCPHVKYVKRFIIMDAGTTGTRAYYYRIQLKSTAQDVRSGDFLLQHSKKYASFAAVTQFLGKKEDLRTKLKDVLETIKADVSPACVASTVVKLRATAGLRESSDEARNDLLHELSTGLQCCGFSVNESNGAQILPGYLEGYYMWLAANFLKRTLSTRSSEKTYALLELGGGSTQVTFVMNDKFKARMGNFDAHYHSFDALGNIYHLYIASYDKRGLQAARQHFISKDNTSVCVRSKELVDFELGTTKITFTGAPINRQERFEACSAKARRLMSPFKSELGSEAGPKPQIMATAAFYYAIRTALLINAASSEVEDEYVLTMDELELKAKFFCFDPPGKHRAPELMFSQYLCIDLVYILTLLRDGYGIESKRAVTFTQSEALGWPLGLALQTSYYEFRAPAAQPTRNACNFSRPFCANILTASSIILLQMLLLSI